MLPPSDDFDDFETVTGLELALGKFGRSDGFAVVLDDDAARQEILSEQKLFECTRKIALDWSSVGDDEGHSFCD